MFHLTSTARVLGIALVGASVACSDATIPTSPVALGSAGRTTASVSEGRGVFQRYAAIGTSVSMGWASDGGYAAAQVDAWPAQLARMAHREMTLPLIGGEGCQAPLAAPLISFRRTNGRSVADPRGSNPCAANEEGVVLPSQNVAIVAATTRDAIFTTPESASDPNTAPVYARVLGPGQSQLTAALSQNPKIVTVELGANEVLAARNGAVTSLTPVHEWAPLYTQLVNSVAEVAKHGLLVGLTHEVATFPGFRFGSELYDDRAAFAAAFHVTVAPDCNASQNLLFVPVRVPAAVAEGLTRRARGFPPATLSCAGHPLPAVQDYVLTPAEVAVIKAQLAEMNAYIAAEAARVGFAHAELEAFFGRSDLKARFSVVTLMTTGSPYGPLMSLDGIHANAAGQRIIAEAAARALDERYGFGILTSAAMIASR